MMYNVAAEATAINRWREIMKAQNAKSVPLNWTKLSKGHYEAIDAKTASVFNLDVYEPDGERYFWLVTRSNGDGLDVEICGADELAAAKTFLALAVKKLAAGKTVNSVRSTKADDRPEILECSRNRASGTVRPPKVEKPAPVAEETVSEPLAEAA